MVKNFNLIFVTVVVVVSNLIDGFQFNQTPPIEPRIQTGNQVEFEKEPVESRILLADPADVNAKMPSTIVVVPPDSSEEKIVQQVEDQAPVEVEAPAIELETVESTFSTRTNDSDVKNATVVDQIEESIEAITVEPELLEVELPKETIAFIEQSTWETPIEETVLLEETTTEPPQSLDDVSESNTDFIEPIKESPVQEIELPQEIEQSETPVEETIHQEETTQSLNDITESLVQEIEIKNEVEQSTSETPTNLNEELTEETTLEPPQSLDDIAESPIEEIEIQKEVEQSTWETPINLNEESMDDVTTSLDISDFQDENQIVEEIVLPEELTQSHNDIPESNTAATSTEAPIEVKPSVTLSNLVTRKYLKNKLQSEKPTDSPVVDPIPNKTVNQLAEADDDKQSNKSNDLVTPLQVMFATGYPSKYCADLKPIKELFNSQIGSIYMPLISMFPEEFQVVLLDETSMAGLNRVSCFLIGSAFFTLLLLWFVLLRQSNNQKRLHEQLLNEQLLIIENNLKKSTFEKQTFELELNEMEMKYNDCQVKLNEKEDKLKQLNETSLLNITSAQLSQKEIDKLRGIESKLNKELGAAKLELATLKEKMLIQNQEFQSQCIAIEQSNQLHMNSINSRVNELENELTTKNSLVEKLEVEVSALNETESNLRQLVEEKDKSIQLLQNCMLREGKKSVARELRTKEEDEESIVVVSNDEDATNSLDSKNF